jgi:hypothetical protein
MWLLSTYSRHALLYTYSPINTCAAFLIHFFLIHGNVSAFQTPILGKEHRNTCVSCCVSVTHSFGFDIIHTSSTTLQIQHHGFTNWCLLFKHPASSLHQDQASTNTWSRHPPFLFMPHVDDVVDEYITISACWTLTTPVPWEATVSESQLVLRHVYTRMHVFVDRRRCLMCLVSAGLD